MSAQTYRWDSHLCLFAPVALARASLVEGKGENTDKLKRISWQWPTPG